jgi:uncharacterized protein (TIGR03118 family)
MYGFFRRWLRTSFSRERMPRPQRVCLCLELLEDRLVPSVYLQINLVSDVHGQAPVFDANLKNPWGVSESASSPFWVSDQGTNVSTLYKVTSAGVSIVSPPSPVSIPTTVVGPQGPTGQVFNSTSSFDLSNDKPALFIFANLNGTISAWNGGSSATIEATTPGAVYTGLAIGSNAQGNFLYAADNSMGTIDVFDGSFRPVTLGTGGFGTFTDPNLPSGLVPFNVQNINGDLYVTYAPMGHPAQTAATPGQGAVAVFDTSGNFIRQLTAGGPLASPWGLALAPSTFGQFGGDLLVGNFSYKYSDINAFDPATGKLLGTLTGVNGQPLLNPGLWALTFGNGGNGGNPSTLYFSAGIDSEQEGLFGAIQAFPTLTTPTTPPAQLAYSIFAAVDQGIGDFLQTFDTNLLSLESRLTAMNSSLSSFFTTLNGNLDALKTSILLGLEAVEDGVIASLNRLTASGSTTGSPPAASPPPYNPY